MKMHQCESESHNAMETLINYDKKNCVVLE